MVLNRLPFDELHNDEFVQAFDQGCSLVATSNPNSNPAIEARRVIASNYSPLLKVLFSKDPASEKTAMIVKADHRRDGYVTGIKSLAFGNTKFDEDMTIVDAALVVLRLFQKHGDINKHSINEETAIINQIILETETDTVLMAAITKLNLSPWFVALKKINNTVNNLYLLRIQEQGNQPQDNPAEKRKEAQRAYQHLMDGIDSAANLDDTDSYATLINHLNELAAKYETTVAARKTKNAAPTKPN